VYERLHCSFVYKHIRFALALEESSSLHSFHFINDVMDVAALAAILFLIKCRKVCAEKASIKAGLFLRKMVGTRYGPVATRFL